MLGNTNIQLNIAVTNKLSTIYDKQ